MTTQGNAPTQRGMRWANELADQLSASDRDAVVYWLRHSTANQAGRVELGRRIMFGSYAAQASLFGLVSCGRCADLGCDWCADTLGRRRR